MLAGFIRVLATWSLLTASALAQEAAGTPPAADAEQGYIVALVVNGRRIDDAVLVQRRGEAFYVPRAVLLGARMIVPPGTPVLSTAAGDMVSLNMLPGVSVRFDGAGQELTIVAGLGAIEPQTLDLSSRPAIGPAVSTVPGGFLNYDVLAQAASEQNYVAGFLDGGVGLLGGTLTGTMLAGTLDRPVTRLETAFIYDLPERRERLKIGDGISRGGDWGRPYRFGGVQLATNFDVQPGFTAFPSPAFAGQAALPSTVDVFVNGALRYRGTVEQGPFSLNQIPAVAGSGEARVVLTDALGRQESVLVPFYSSPRLLREGLSDYSYEFGALRGDFQVDSFDYGEAAFSATHRYGITDDVTVEGHLDATKRHRSVGGSVTGAVMPLGELHADLAGAHGEEGVGWLAGFGWSRAVGGGWTFGARQRWKSADFEDRDLTGGITPSLSESLATVGLSTAGYGSYSVSVARQTFETLPPATVGSALWSMPLGRSAFVNVFALASRQTVTSTTVGLSLTFLLGRGKTIAAESSLRDGDLAGKAQARQSSSSETGWSYGALASRGGPDRIGADIVRRTGAGDFGVAVERADTRAAGRFTASGAVAFVDGKAFAARRIDDSFALVSVPGFAGVTVLQENRPVGQTDEDGDLLLPKLISNYPIKIGLQAEELPMDASIDVAERMVTPGYRRPSVIGFDLRPTHARYVILRRGDGSAVGAGTRIVRVTDGAEFFAGFGGEAFIEPLAGGSDTEFDVEDAPGACRVILPASAPATERTELSCRSAS